MEHQPSLKRPGSTRAARRHAQPTASMIVLSPVRRSALLADGQPALRRIANARGSVGWSPDEGLDCVASAVHRLIAPDTTVSIGSAGGMWTVVAAFASTAMSGSPLSWIRANAAGGSEVLAGRAVRIEDDGGSSGALRATSSRGGITVRCASPILFSSSVLACLWSRGAMCRCVGPMPQLTEFADIAGCDANARQSRPRSRRRAPSSLLAAYDTRRRIERNCTRSPSSSWSHSVLGSWPPRPRSRRPGWAPSGYLPDRGRALTSAVEDLQECRADPPGDPRRGCPPDLRSRRSPRRAESRVELQLRGEREAARGREVALLLTFVPRRSRTGPSTPCASVVRGDVELTTSAFELVSREHGGRWRRFRARLGAHGLSDRFAARGRDRIASPADAGRPITRRSGQRGGARPGGRSRVHAASFR